MIYFFSLCDVAEVQEQEIKVQLSVVSLPSRTEGKLILFSENMVISLSY